MLRWDWGQRSNMATAARGSVPARRCGAGVARVWWRLWGEDRVPGGAAGWFKDGAPGSRRARPIRKAGEHLGRGLRCSVVSAWRGGDETDSWAQGVRRGHVLRGLLRQLLGCGGC